MIIEIPVIHQIFKPVINLMLYKIHHYYKKSLNNLLYTLNCLIDQCNKGYCISLYNFVLVEEDKAREQRFGRFLQSKDVINVKGNRESEILINNENKTLVGSRDINNVKGDTDSKILSNDEHSTSVGETDINNVKGDTDSEKLIQNEETNEISMPSNTSFDVEKINSSSENMNDVKNNPSVDIEGKHMEQLNGRGKQDDINKSTNSAKGFDPNHTATSSLALNTDDKRKDETEDINNIFDDVEKGLNTQLSDDEYADCIFLDFAGQKEYYTTHQTFLTKKAVYLITASLQDSNVFSNKDDEGKFILKLRSTFYQSIVRNYTCTILQRVFLVCAQ